MTTASCIQNIQKQNHSQYLTNFKQHLLNLSKSTNTIDSYSSDLKQYFTTFTVIDRKNIQQYKKQISSLAATTINRKLSSLKQYNEFLVSQNLINEIYIYKQDFIRIQDRGNPTNITEKTVLNFLIRVTTKHSKHKSRNTAIIYLMANTGIRRDEVCNILVSNITGNKLKIIGKGNKERTIILNNKAIEVINAYLIDRSNSKHANSPYLFLSQRGSKLTKESINGIFEFYSTPKCRVTPHDLRHNWCSTMIEKGILTPKEVQNQAGHSSILTTDRYTHARLDSIEKKVGNYQIG